MTHKIREVDVEKYEYMSTNFAKTLVWKQDYDVTNSAHEMEMTTIRH